MPGKRHLSGPLTRSILLAFVLVAQTALAPAVAAAPDDQQPRECVESGPTQSDGVSVTVERGPVENSVKLSVDPMENQSVLDSLWFELPPGTSLDTTTGFERHSPERRIYTTVENARAYSLTYTFAENSTTNGTAASAELRPYEGEDDWAVAPLPQDYHGIAGFQSPSEAAIGQQTVYFGNYSATTVENGCHRIQMVVPEAVDLHRNRTAILDSLKYADSHLGGQRYDDVTIFVSPENFSVALGGVARNADIVMAAGGQLAETDTRSALWLHEYIHTRQSYWPEGDMEWWTEASATYLSLRMGLQSGYLSPVRYNALLANIGETDTGDAVLVDNTTWHNYSTYDRGVLALSRLDAELRSDTNGTVTVVSVFNMTEYHRPQTHNEFMTVLEDRTGNRYDEWSKNYIRGTTKGELKMQADTPYHDRLLYGLLGILVVVIAVEYLDHRQNSANEPADESSQNADE